MSARHTGEKSLSTTIGFINATTHGAGLTGVSGINKDHRNTHSFSLVADVLTQLVERPVSVLASLLATNRCLTNTAQIFQSDSAVSVLRFSNKLFTDRVVSVGLEPGLPTGKFLEFALSGLRTVALKVTATMFIFAPVVLDFLTAKLFSVAVGCNIYYTKINTEKSVNVNRFGSFNIACGEQIKLAINKTQVAFAALLQEQFHLARTCGEPDSLPPANRPNRDGHFVNLPGQDTVVKRNRSMWLKSALCFVVNFVSICHLGDRAHHDLSGELKHLLDDVISKFVQWELAKSLSLPSLFTDVVASSVGYLKRLLEHISLFHCREELDFRCEFHNYNYITILKRKETAFLSSLKDGVSSGNFL